MVCYILYMISHSKKVLILHGPVQGLTRLSSMFVQDIWRVRYSHPLHALRTLGSTMYRLIIGFNTVPAFMFSYHSNNVASQ